MVDESRISELIRQAESCADKGELAQARLLYAEVCRVQEDNTQAWLMLGAVSGELGNFDAAQNAVERAIALDAHNAEAHLTLAHLLREKGQPTEALASAARAVAADAGFVEGWLFIAAAEGQRGNWAGAEDACNKALALAPERVEAHVNHGNALLAAGRMPQAEEAFRLALKISEIPEAWYGLGIALGAQNSLAEAESALSAALRLDSGKNDFRVALAQCLERMGRTDESAWVRAGRT